MIRAFVRDNGVLLAATGVVTPLSLLFSILTARALGPEAYGVLAVMIALQQVLAQTVGSFSLVTAKYVAEYRAVGDQPASAAFLRRMLALVLQVGAASIVALAALSPIIRGFLHLSSITTVMLVGVLFAGTLGVEVVRGLLQGMQAFGRLALNQIAEAIVRLALGLGILAAGFAINGVIVAYLLGVLAAIAMVVPLLRAMTAHPGPRPALGPILVFTRTVVLVGVCNIILANADLILVKHYFAAFDAGVYAAVAAFGRMLYVGATVLWTTMYPSVAAMNATRGGGARLLLLNIGALLAFAALAVVVLALFGRPLLTGLYGGAYAAGAGLLALYALSVLLALPVNAINFYIMAQSRTNFLPLYIIGVGLQIVLIVAFHATLRQVVLMVCAGNAAMLAGYGLWGVPGIRRPLHAIDGAPPGALSGVPRPGGGRPR